MALDVIHQLALVGTLAANKFFEGDVVQHGSDGAIHIGPDRLEVAGVLFAAIVVEASGFQARKLNERPAHASNDVAYRDLAGRPR